MQRHQGIRTQWPCFTLYVRYYCGPLCIRDYVQLWGWWNRRAMYYFCTIRSVYLFIWFHPPRFELVPCESSWSRSRDRHNLDLIILRHERKHQGQTRSFRLLVSSDSWFFSFILLISLSFSRTLGYNQKVIYKRFLFFLLSKSKVRFIYK